MGIRRVLVAIDGSECAAHALKAVAELATALAAETVNDVVKVRVMKRAGLP